MDITKHVNQSRPKRLPLVPRRRLSVLYLELLLLCPNAVIALHQFLRLPKRRPFETLNQQVRCFRVSKKRSKIEAAFGKAQYFKPENLLIAPDYQKSEEIFVKYVSLMLEKLPTLEFLSVTEDGRGERSNKLPSWCPDYRIGSQFRLFCGVFRV